MRSFKNSIGEDDFRALGNKLIEVAIEITLRLGNVSRRSLATKLPVSNPNDRAMGIVAHSLLTLLFI